MGAGESRRARGDLLGLPAKAAALLVVPAIRGCYTLKVSVGRWATLFSAPGGSG